MGQLVEGEIPQIFNGVSRQPDSVRYPGQVEDAENVQFSVESGGFSKRLGTRIKKKISGLSVGSKRKLHLINRDSTERYRVVLSNGSLRVFDSSYTERTVTASAGNLAWLTDDPDNFTLLTALDYTFIAKKTQTVAMASTVAPAAPALAVIYIAAVPDISAAVAYVVKVNGTTAGSYSANLSTDTTTTIATNLGAAITTGLGASYTVTVSGSYIFIKQNAGTAFTVTSASPRGDTSMLSYVGTITDASLAPAKAIDGMMLQVKGVSGLAFWIKFIAKNATSGEGYWVEAAAPGTKVAFDNTTMPRALVRNGDGTFTLDVLTWNNKMVGGDIDVPNPEFVGLTVQDILFTRNRLGLVAGETVYYSVAGDYFNFWPASATQTTDEDPFGLTNTTNSVSKFYFAIPFRRSTFIMGDNAQFEIGGLLLTASQASIDLATSYSASPVCRPVAVGDELYFPAEVGKVASVMSYVFEQSSVSETANDVSKHIEGYIPTPVVEMVGDPVRGQLMLLSGAERSALYVHRFYYQGQDRVQSAWGKYVFAGHTILSIQVIDGVVQMLVEWKSAVWLMELPSVEDIYKDFDWTPRTDAHQFITGTYTSFNNRTTWDLGYNATDPVAVTSNLFPDGKRMLSVPLTVSGTTVYATGDWSSAAMMIGENFDAFVELSRQFLRNQNNAAIIAGRLQLRTMSLRYTGTGYFTVDVTNDGRDTRSWIFSGRTLGSLNNRIQRFSIQSGTYRFGVRGNAETTTIRIGSDKFMPFSIVSAVWAGFFNEITRQG
ncbi:MAG: hypothetical protein P4M09_17280 [Devosia sp.]|nr:hypothetical protein [Devosia sp.]